MFRPASRQRKYDGEGTDSPEPAAPRNSSSTSAHLSLERFFQLGQDVAVMKVQLGEVRGDLKDLGKRIDSKFERIDSKIDRLLYFFLGGIVLKGGFDIYMNKEVQKDRTAGESCVSKK